MDSSLFLFKNMIIENLTIEELRKFVASHCIDIKKDFKTLKAGQSYQVDQDKYYVYIMDDDNFQYTFTYDEADELI